MKKSVLPLAAAAVLIIAGATLTSCEKEDVKPFYNSDKHTTLEQKNHVREATPFEYKVNKDAVQTNANLPKEKENNIPLQNQDGYNNTPVSDSI